MKKKIKQIFNKIIVKYQIIRAENSEKKGINNYKRKQIIRNYNLTDMQKKEIDRLFIENYGKKISYDWHRLYSSYTGSFDVNYFPELLFIPDLQRFLVPKNYGKTFEDKNLLDFLIGNSTEYGTAKVYISCINGIYRNSEYKFIDLAEATKILYNIGEVFIKPTVDSNSGKGCRFLNIVDSIDIISGESVDSLLTNSGMNFNIQEVLKNSNSVSRLHPNSLNTFRIITYIWKGKVYHVPVALRIGIGNSSVDNAHSGGIFISVSDNGVLNECAYTEFQNRYYEHPDTKIKFKGYKVPEVKKAIKVVELLHQRIPQVGIISWDVVVNDKGKVIIVELNLTGQSIWFPQMASGKSAFGDRTPYILKFIYDSKKNL